jgi:hypothetical protein
MLKIVIIVFSVIAITLGIVGLFSVVRFVAHIYRDVKLARRVAH